MEIAPRIAARIVAFVTLLSLSGCNHHQMDSKPLAAGSLATEGELAKATRLIEAISDSSSGLDYGGVAHQLTLDCIRDAGHDVPRFTANPLLTMEEQDPVWGGQTRWVSSTPVSLARMVAARDRGSEETDDADSQFNSNTTPELTGPAATAYYGEVDKDVEVEISGVGSYGMAVGGCRGEAFEKLYGVPAEVYARTHLELKLLKAAPLTASTSSTVVAATESYSQCMKESTFTTPSPASVPEEIMNAVLHDNTGQVDYTELEQSFNEADANCKEQSEVSAIYAAEFLARAAKNSEKLDDVAYKHREMLANADNYIERSYALK